MKPSVYKINSHLELPLELFDCDSVQNKQNIQNKHHQTLYFLFLAVAVVTNNKRLESNLDFDSFV